MKCDPSQLFGDWLIHGPRFEVLVETAKSAQRTAPTAAQKPGYRRTGRAGSLAVVDISGPLTKYPTSFQEVFGGTSTVEARDAIRAATEDPAVKGIVLMIDSPGGTVAGTADLAAEVARARKKKSVYAIVDDMAASAAYWIASQAEFIYANEAAMVGSIGTVLRLYDESKRLESAGIKIHVIASSKFKATGQGGPITDDQLSDVQRVVDELQAVFVGAIAKGRKMSLEQAAELADGRIHIGQKAQALGLVDAIVSVGDALEDIDRKVQTMSDPIGTFASANPAAVETWRAEGFAKGREQGHKDGVVEGAAAERKRASDIAAAFADRPKFAVEHIAKGSSLVDAKIALADVVVVELKEANARAAELQKKVEANAGGATVPFNGSPTAGTFDRKALRLEDVHATATRMWADDAMKKRFSNNYAAFHRWLESEAKANAAVA